VLSRSVSRLAAPGRFVMTASGQTRRTADSNLRPDRHGQAAVSDAGGMPPRAPSAVLDTLLNGAVTYVRSGPRGEPGGMVRGKGASRGRDVLAEGGESRMRVAGVPDQPRRIVRRRPARRPGRVHGRRSGPVERQRAGRRSDRSRMAGQAQLVSGRHRGPDGPATGAAGPILGLSTQAASDCSPRQIRSRTRMHSIRHHPASVGTQIRQFGRGATGHGSDQDAAHRRISRDGRDQRS
jgi:hypothetical protein